MTMRTTEELAAVPDLETLYGELDARSINAGWAKPTPSLWAEPRKNFLPARWRWEDGRAALNAAGRLVDTELAERRNLILFNPLEGNTYGTVRTLICAYQAILPGETARSHRHTPNALRFILEGEGSYTVVDGQRLEMRPNDVLLTPNWSWHGHGSEAEGMCYWLDCLDAPLVHMLEPMFFEGHPQGFEPVTSVPNESPFIFPWEKVQAALDREKPNAEGRFGRRVQLGRPAMSSIALYMERLEAGQATQPFRTTANRIYCCAEGRGETVVDGETFTWTRGDVIAAPAWRPVAHRAEADSTLFWMTDEPLMRTLGWLRVEGEA
jgi:gentisate 1,2-dioxygenase